MSLTFDVKNLSVKRGSSEIVSNVSLSLKGGELVALLGPSGSGKSTLLRAMIGFSPGRGRVSVSGRDLYAKFEEMKSEIGFVPQDDVLHTSLTVERTLEYAAALRLAPSLESRARAAAVTAVLAHVELSDRRGLRVRRLSGGQRKRVAIAVELLAKPPLLFLDEPTSGLNPALEEKMMALFRSLTSPDRITVLSTHILASLSVVDLLVIIAKGRVAFIGPPSEAKPFFGADDFADIYRKLGEKSPREWAMKLETSSLYRTYVSGRLS